MWLDLVHPISCYVRGDPIFDMGSWKSIEFLMILELSDTSFDIPWFPATALLNRTRLVQRIGHVAPARVRVGGSSSQCSTASRTFRRNRRGVDPSLAMLMFFFFFHPCFVDGEKKTPISVVLDYQSFQNVES
jgi:hypothetical protein